MAPSSVAWLDTSPDEQRRVREMLRLFTQQESRDEIGIGQIRDAMSNALFPGTSVIQTRARYFLFVPWCFQEAQRGSSADVAARAERNERVLADVLRAGTGGEAGVIGALVGGTALKTLPSSIYWNGLLALGILRREVAPNRLAAHLARAHSDGDPAHRDLGDWHPTLPPVPPGFPRALDGGFHLTAAEAQWLRERILDAVPGSLLADLAGHPTPPDDGSGAPWTDSAVDACVTDRSTLDHAHRFSYANEGAVLLYNLLLARAYEQAGFSAVTDPAARYEQAYGDWLAHRDRGLLDGWDVGDFWSLVHVHSPNVTPRTRRFVEAWLDAVRTGAADRATEPDSEPARLVATRERELKGPQSRLANHRLLASWQGASMAPRLVFRWPQVKTLLTDLQEGLVRAGA